MLYEKECATLLNTKFLSLRELNNFISSLTSLIQMQDNTSIKTKTKFLNNSNSLTSLLTSCITLKSSGTMQRFTFSQRILQFTYLRKGNSFNVNLMLSEWQFRKFFLGNTNTFIYNHLHVNSSMPLCALRTKNTLVSTYSFHLDIELPQQIDYCDYSHFTTNISAKPRSI